MLQTTQFAGLQNSISKPNTVRVKQYLVSDVKKLIIKTLKRALYHHNVHFFSLGHAQFMNSLDYYILYKKMYKGLTQELYVIYGPFPYTVCSTQSSYVHCTLCAGSTEVLNRQYTGIMRQYTGTVLCMQYTGTTGNTQALYRQHTGTVQCAGNTLALYRKYKDIRQAVHRQRQAVHRQ